MTNQDWQTQARELLSHAIQAPSSHNTQPWLFRISAGAIDLFADRTRALPVNDPEDRELTISCGCALMNLRVAAAAEGLASLVRLEPDPDEPDLLASIRFSPMADASLDEAALAPAIGQRRTYRKRFAEQGVDAVIIRNGRRRQTSHDGVRHRSQDGCTSDPGTPGRGGTA